MKLDVVKLARLRNVEALRGRAEALGIALPVADRVQVDGALAQPIEWRGGTIGNRFAILPMEGWDGTRSGAPTERVRRRWQRFGASGAKLIWGGEAVAVRPDGRANPHQLISNDDNAAALAALREDLVAAHQAATGRSDDLLIGLQLTHSGRFARPEGKPVPRIAYRHPILDSRVGVADDASLLTDLELDDLVLAFVGAAVRAQRGGYDFVDIKHCHGYLGHELLTAYDRPGAYGGDLAGRTRLLERIIAGIHSDAPGLEIGVRLSLFDFVPFRRGAAGAGEPEPHSGNAYPYAFGGDGSGTGIDLTEVHTLLRRLQELGIRLICTTAGSPYYVPHIQRPALYPPSDGYSPPEDPLVGVARQIEATAAVKRAHPDLVIVGSGYSYLQEWLPAVAEAGVAADQVDSIGLGRMALSYPTLPSDVLAGRVLEKSRICRTFSDCTTAPRNGLVSGCYPLDPAYRGSPEYAELARIKASAR